MGKETITIDFGESADRFSRACKRAADWKHQYFGAAYSTRITQAIADLEHAIREVRDFMRVDENDR